MPRLIYTPKPKHCGCGLAERWMPGLFPRSRQDGSHSGDEIHHRRRMHDFASTHVTADIVIIVGMAVTIIVIVVAVLVVMVAVIVTTRRND